MHLIGLTPRAHKNSQESFPAPLTVSHRGTRHLAFDLVGHLVSGFIIEVGFIHIRFKKIARVVASPHLAFHAPLLVCVVEKERQNQNHRERKGNGHADLDPLRNEARSGRRRGNRRAWSGGGGLIGIETHRHWSVAAKRAERWDHYRVPHRTRLAERHVGGSDGKHLTGPRGEWAFLDLHAIKMRRPAGELDLNPLTRQSHLAMLRLKQWIV